MSVSRRGFLTGRSGPFSGAFIAARGMEAHQADAAQERNSRSLVPPGVAEIRISSNENPLGPGKAVLDAILGKFPEASRYPFNSTPNDGALTSAIAAKFKVKPENVVLGGGSQEILKNAVRAFTSPTRRSSPVRHRSRTAQGIAKRLGHPIAEIKVDSAFRLDLDGDDRRIAKAPAWCSSTTRTTRRRRSTARRPSPTSSPASGSLAGHGDPDRRGVSRLRHRPVVRERDAARARQRRTSFVDADVLEGVRDGGHAHRLRDRPGRDDQAARRS